MLTTITRRVEFDAGHRIPDHKSKCRNVHGHRYVLECTVTGKLGDQGSDRGMIKDFGDLKQIMLDNVAEPWDHAFLVYCDDELMLRALTVLDTKGEGGWVQEVEPDPPYDPTTQPYDEPFKHLTRTDKGFAHKTVVLDKVPTVENLVEIAASKIVAHFGQGVELVHVRLYETPNCWADWSGAR